MADLDARGILTREDLRSNILTRDDFVVRVMDLVEQTILTREDILTRDDFAFAQHAASKLGTDTSGIIRTGAVSGMDVVTAAAPTGTVGTGSYGSWATTIN